MKIMLIGVGRWGNNHLRTLINLKTNLYVAELSPDIRKKCFEMGIKEDRLTDDYKKFLDIVSAVVVVTPAPYHFEICKEAIEKGKDVFVEKPITVTAKEALILAELATQKKVIFQVGHIFRFDPATDFIKDYLRSSEMGKILSIYGNFSGFKRPRSDGGAMVSDGIHFIDLFNYILNDFPINVFCRLNDHLKRNMDDMSWLFMNYKKDISTLIEANYFSPDKHRYINIIGEKATLVCDYALSQDKIKIYKNQHIKDNNTWKAINGEIIMKEIMPAEPLMLELQDFVSCVKTRTSPRADVYSGVDTMKIIEAAMQSSKEGKVINF